MKRKLQVLVMDNSPVQTSGIRNLLNHYTDYVSVERVKDGWDAVTENNTTPDLVVLDNNIPGENGIELLVGIRMKHPKAKLMMFTHDPEPYYRNMCEMVGADYFYDRTFSMSMLPESLKLMILNYQITA
ncbi:MAG: response regulator [Bacteroidia bacterium]|nr:response regulator [Bacteroidia bacterium]